MNIARHALQYDEEVAADKEKVELSEVHSLLQEKVTVLGKLVDRCSEGLAEKAQPKVAGVLESLTDMATPLIDAMAINGNEAGTILEKLGANSIDKEHFNGNKNTLEENVIILNWFHLFA